MGDSGVANVVRKPAAEAGVAADVTYAMSAVADESANLRNNNGIIQNAVRKFLHLFLHSFMTFHTNQKAIVIQSVQLK